MSPYAQEFPLSPSTFKRASLICSLYNTIPLHAPYITPFPNLGLREILLCWFEWKNLDLAWESQSTPHRDTKKKGMCPEVLSLSALYLDLPVWQLKVCRALPGGPGSNKFLY